VLYIVKFFDEDVNENYELEYGSLSHAEETYGIYFGMLGVKNLEILSYKDGKYTKIK
jgi:hypothetical protein